MHAALSLAFWAYLATSIVVWWLAALVLWIVTLPFDHRRTVLHLYTCAWAAHYLYVNPFWRLRVHGRQHIRRRGTYVIVANHQSLGDILVLFALFRHFKWVAKAASFRVPFLGWNMRMNDYVAVDRQDPESKRNMMHACMRHLRRGSSVLLFPEGTRSRDGELQPFRHGAFTLAGQAGVDVVPVVIDGTFSALPRGTWVFEHRARHTVFVRVLEPVTLAEAHGQVQRLRELVHARMAAELTNMRSEAGRPVQPISRTTSSKTTPRHDPANNPPR